VGINQNQVGLPPEAKISLGPAVDPDTTFASVFWQTSAATDSKLLFSDSQASVEAGTADSAFTAADSVGVTRHGVRIDGLTKFVKYFFRIHATDPFGRTSFSAIDSFRTLGVPDLQPPIIDILPSVQDLRPDQVTIIWGTDRRATSEVTLDTTAAFTGPTVVSDFDPVQNHSVVASGLLAGKKYWYVASSAAANQKVVGDTLTFTTPNSQDTTAPVITTIPPFVDPGSITATTAQLDWTTNVAANSVVTFWQADSTDTLTVVEPAENTNHSINITGLTAGTKYLYQVRSDRAANNTSVSSITLMFRTRQDAASLRFRRDPALGYIADTFGLLRWRANRPHFGTVYFQVDDGSHTLDLLEGYHKADTDTWIQRI